MNISHAAVHLVEDPRTVEAADVPRLRMNDFRGMPATFGGFTLWLFHFLFVFSIRALFMASTSDFPSVTAFRYLVAAAGLQCLWSFSLAITDIYALLVRRSLQNCQLVTLFAVCDGITSTLTLAAACALAGITALIDNDLGNCSQNHCTQFEDATTMAFASWFVALPSFLFNYWSLVIR